MTTPLKYFRLNLLFPAIFFGLLTLTACRHKKEIIQTPPEGSCRLDRRLPRPLINDMRKGEFHFSWLSAKIDCEASDDSSRLSFNAAVRMRYDSAIWMNITDPVMGISVARVLITCDSVKFIQFLPEEKCFKGDFAYLSMLLQTDVDFDMMQSLLVGNSVSFYEEDEKLNSSVNKEECNYTLSTIRKRKLRKIVEGQKPLQDPLQTISLDPSSFKILKILFLDAQNRTFTAMYSDFSLEDSMSFPHKAVFYARGARKSARLDVTFKKLKLNQPLELPFSFPDDCKPIIVPEPPQPPQGNGQEAPQPGQH